MSAYLNYIHVHVRSQINFLLIRKILLSFAFYCKDGTRNVEVERTFFDKDHNSEHGGGGGVTSIIKVYTDVQLEGVYFSGLQIYKWVLFSHQKYINGVSFSFSPKKYMNG